MSGRTHLYVYILKYFNYIFELNQAFWIKSSFNLDAVTEESCYVLIFSVIVSNFFLNIVIVFNNDIKVHYKKKHVLIYCSTN